ncbi:MAG: hypothetical protein U5K69_20085 [Balneolaceae bacterium]|nr:hypothetical protein [Balneolaceae bacterium]
MAGIILMNGQVGYASAHNHRTHIPNGIFFKNGVCTHLLPVLNRLRTLFGRGWLYGLPRN